MEKILQLIETCGSLMGISLTIPAGIWTAIGWTGHPQWEQAQERAREMGVSLNHADYRPVDFSKEGTLLQEPVFVEELRRSSERDDALDSWRNLSRLKNRHRLKAINPAVARTTDYESLFEESLTPEEARDKLAGLVEDLEKRADPLRKAILTNPVQPVRLYLETLPKKDANEGSYLLVTQRFLSYFESSGVLALRGGEIDDAVETIRSMERLSQTLKGSDLIGSLVAQAGNSAVDSLIWEGIRLRVWTDGHLDQLSKTVAKREFYHDCLHALAYDAAWTVALLDEEEGFPDVSELVMVIGPRSNGLKELLFNAYYLEGTDGWRAHRKAFGVKHVLDQIAELNQKPEARWRPVVDKKLHKWHPLALIDSAGLLNRGIKALTERSPTKQRLVLAAIACERHFLKNGTYPKTLAGLNPNFQLTDLTDPEARDLAYKIDSQGRPVIWSRAEEAKEEPQKARKLRWQFYEEIER